MDQSATTRRGTDANQVEAWLRPDDPPWSWAQTGRSGGVREDQDAGFEPNASGLALPTSSVRGIQGSGSRGFFAGDQAGPAKRQASKIHPAGPSQLLEHAALESNRFSAKSSVSGNSYPRIAPLSSPHWDYSYGQAAINWSREVLGIELLPWQQFLLLEGCARRNNRFRYRTLLTIVARQNGKTTLAMVRALAGLYLFGEQYIIGAAQTRNVALESWQEALDLATDRGLPIHKTRFRIGGESFYGGSGRYSVIAANKGAARGLSGVDLVIMDEIRTQTNFEAYGAIDKTRRARPDSQLWAITTEGDLTSEVLNKLQDQARENILQGRESPLGYWEWSAPPGAHPGQVETWRQSNPALGWTLDETTIQAEYDTDPADIFEVEVLCRKVSSLKAWVKPDDFDRCATDVQFPLDQPFVLGLDAGPELRHVSIVAGALDGAFSHVEHVASFTGPNALTEAETRLEALLSRWQPYALVTLHRSPCEASAARIGAAAGVEHLTVRPAEWARACRAFYAAVNQRTIRHPGGPGITDALAATKRGPDGLVSSVHRLNPEADIDAAVAAVLAMWVPTQQPAPEPIPQWTVF